MDNYDDIKDEFIDLADELANKEDARLLSETRRRFAHARTLQETAAKMQEVSDAVEEWSDRWIGAGESHSYFMSLFSRYLLPQPDPDEQLAREVADEMPLSGSQLAVARDAALATIKALRDKGRLK